MLAKAFGEQTGRTIGARKPCESDELRPVWTLAEARRFGLITDFTRFCELRTPLRSCSLRA